MDNTEEEYTIIWEAPILEKPEFRLYYDEKGYPLCYTCEKLDGEYVVIDALTFAEARPDVRVVDGQLVKASSGAVISRLYPSTEGVMCEKQDISVIAQTNGQYWKLKTVSL